MTNFEFGACPRCGGDACEDRDLYGKYVYAHCVQCGYMGDLSLYFKKKQVLNNKNGDKKLITNLIKEWERDRNTE